MKQWYESLFENYGRKYDTEPFTQGTSGECDFIEDEIGRNKRLKILDVGCGTGRHSIELARRGYQVTGVDLSDSMLTRAREKATGERVNVTFRKEDARNLPFTNEFDLVIMLCEGAFPLMETDEMNFKILAGVSMALRHGGRLIFTTLNGLFPLFHSVKDFIDSNSKEENAATEAMSFSLMTFREHSATKVVDDLGNEKELDCSERYYVPSEISWMLKSLGFHTVDIFGATLGKFSRKDRLTTEDFEMLVVADK
jgi:2-polyprenyl-3-methyl-5-hydroxy-6-metoxy-1,4-benzoquinol methylase